MFFGVKRVHLEVVHRVARRVLQGSGLTAARFDLMRVVHAWPGISQRKLQWLLGVSAPTVSRMLKALEGRGLVLRTRDTRDRRRLLLKATPAGNNAVEIALGGAVWSREGERVVARCAVGDRDNAKKRSGAATSAFISAAKEKVGALIGTMMAMRAALFDRAPLRYPWPVRTPVPSLDSAIDQIVDYTDEEIMSEDWFTEEEWFTEGEWLAS